MFFICLTTCLCIRGSLSIRPTDAYVDWVAADLLPAIDSSLYFPPLFKLPNEAELVVGASVPCEYPGLLLPSFLSQLVAACAAEPSKALLPRLVRFSYPPLSHRPALHVYLFVQKHCQCHLWALPAGLCGPPYGEVGVVNDVQVGPRGFRAAVSTALPCGGTAQSGI